MSGTAISVIVAVGIVVAVLVYVTVWTRRGGYSGLGGDTIVRCRSGHIFTTIWVPGVSFKAVRLGTSRFQYCPIGRHWSVVVPVKDTDLTDEERLEAAIHHDARIP